MDFLVQPLTGPDSWTSAAHSPELPEPRLETENRKKTASTSMEATSFGPYVTLGDSRSHDITSNYGQLVICQPGPLMKHQYSSVYS